MNSDSLVSVVFQIGGVLVSVSLVLLAYAILLRVHLVRAAARQARVLHEWMPALVRSVAGSSEELPPVVTKRSDAVAVLSLWLDFVECLSDVPTQRLIEVLDRARVRSLIPYLLRSRDLRERMLAIAATGHLRETAHWDALVRELDGGASTSLLAARALTQIDAARAMPPLATKLVDRTDWAAPTVASILLGLDRPLVCEALTSVLRHDSLDSARIVRAIDYLAACRCVEALPLISERLSATESVEVSVACLRAMRLFPKQAELPTIRDCLASSSPVVRAEAAAALGRIGGPDDEERLVALLSDEEWWPRFRAAQSLAQLPWVSFERFREIYGSFPAGPTRDVLAMVASEEVATASSLDSLLEEEQPSLQALRPFLAHPNWRIRLQAVERTGLGSGREEQAQLAELLDGEKWWQRYEAARRLVRRPEATPEDLERLMDADPDARTRAALRRAMAERREVPVAD